jgi:peptide/nickel transport system permease protein
MSLSTPASALPDRSSRSLRTLRSSGSARIGIAVLVVIGLCAAVPHLLAPFDPSDQRLLARFTPPFTRASDGTLAVLGTDQLGRDILSRLIYGARTSSLIGFLAVLLAGLVGTALGLLAGVRSGAADHAVMRLADMQLAFPFILLAITVIGILGPSIRNLILVVGLSNWAAYARVVRAETLAVRERAYVEAARSLGLRLPRLVLRHILPNVSASLMVVATFGIAGAILTEAGLSFLGLGVPVAIPSWGGMLAEGRQYVDTRYWLALFPGAALFMTVMAINLLGDTLRDMLDPYLYTRRSLDQL